MCGGFDSGWVSLRKMIRNEEIFVETEEAPVEVCLCACICMCVHACICLCVLVCVCVGGGGWVLRQSVVCGEVC